MQQAMHNRHSLNVRSARFQAPRARPSERFRCFSNARPSQHSSNISTPQQPCQAQAADQPCTSSRREALAAAAALASLAPWNLAVQPARAAEPDLTVTHRIYFDVGVASSAFKPAGERTLGDKTVLPKDAEPAGRIVIGLYGNVAPVTVQNLVATVQSGSFNGSAFSKISPGEFIQLGKQGSRRMGDVEPPPGVLQVNTDLASPAPFKLTHSRPGTVSLSLSDNDEDPKIREKSDYRALEFLITTGPGPVPRLDGLNPVFGRVESGMDVVARLAQVPSFQPDIRSQQLNRFAAFIGDERADNVRRQYGKPLRAIIISDSGVLQSIKSINVTPVAMLAGYFPGQQMKYGSSRGRWHCQLAAVLGNFPDLFAFNWFTSVADV